MRPILCLFVLKIPILPNTICFKPLGVRSSWSTDGDYSIGLMHQTHPIIITTHTLMVKYLNKNAHIVLRFGNLMPRIWQDLPARRGQQTFNQPILPVTQIHFIDPG